MHDGPHGQRGAAGRRAHCCHGGFGERKGRQDMERHVAMMRPGTRWHADGTEVWQETATHMVSELLRGIIS
eukprot:1247745-Lingulodinium_polyedra.AAC.1